jgi:hypothetical protein
MSVNLCDNKCHICGMPAIKVTGERYQGQQKRKGYDNHWFADAECQVCGTKYTAWLSSHHDNLIAGVCSARNNPYHADWFAKHDECFGCLSCDADFFDLSYRSTFNDEPGDEDLPDFPVATVITVKGPYDLEFKPLLDMV